MKADMRSFSEMVDDDPAGAPYVVRHSVLAPELCRAVIAEPTDPRPALGFGGQPHPDGFVIGKQGSESRFHAEVHDIVTEFAQAANDALWNFDAPTTHGWWSQGYRPGAQLGWHADRHAGYSNRKLSIVVLLSDPAEFDGGRFEFRLGEQPHPIDLRQGTIVVFPSWNVHRVAPITAGQRWSIVMWLDGPPWR